VKNLLRGLKRKKTKVRGARESNLKGHPLEEGGGTQREKGEGII